MTDVVAELDRWLAQWEVLEDAEGKRIVLPWDAAVLRARDEILALRPHPKAEEPIGVSGVHALALQQSAQVNELLRKARANALEEAARVCDAQAETWASTHGDRELADDEGWEPGACRDCAAAIRALKEKPG